MDNHQEKDLAQVIREIPWSGIIVPFILSLIVVVIAIVVTVRS